MCGVGLLEVRMLCENPFEGGAGYTPEQVGDMTLDEIYMRLTDKKLLRSGNRRRTVKMDPLEMKSDPDGYIKGRTEDGTPFKAKIGGQSLASRLIEAERQKMEREKAAETEDRRKDRTHKQRRRRRGN